MRKYLSNKGFTLIELLVVLAIIGILIALAIVGLRAAQSSQRDTARKDITAQINAQLQSYQANVGTYPSSSNFAVNGGGAMDPPAFINFGVTCSQAGAVSIYGNCMGMDGLIFKSSDVSDTGTTKADCNYGFLTPTSSDLQLCYVIGASSGGAAGYVFGTMLESGSPTYFVAQ